jgi:hypothetical protein
MVIRYSMELILKINVGNMHITQDLKITIVAHQYKGLSFHIEQ